MSLTDEAVQAISDFRNSTFKEPTSIDEYNKNLQTKLTEIGRRDNNIFYAVRPEYFNNFPTGEHFDAEEYITFRYLFESSYNVRRALVQQKRQQLEQLAVKLLTEHPELATEYESKYNKFNAESMGGVLVSR